MIALKQAAQELLDQVDSLEGYTLSRDLEPHEAQACWDGAIHSVRSAILTALPTGGEATGAAVERLEARISEERDCSVCDGYGKTQRHDPPYGQRDCGGCGATGKILVLDRSLRADIRAILAALSHPPAVEGPVGAEIDRLILLLEAVREMRRSEDKHVRLTDAGRHLETSRDEADLWLARVYERGSVCQITRYIAILAALSQQASPSEAGEWIEWHGGENPVPGQWVETRHECGHECTGKEAWLSDEWHHTFWSHIDDDAHRIIAYRVVTPTSNTGRGG
jgi:hypothetical protein